MSINDFMMVLFTGGLFLIALLTFILELIKMQNKK